MGKYRRELEEKKKETAAANHIEKIKENSIFGATIALGIALIVTLKLLSSNSGNVNNKNLDVLDSGLSSGVENFLD